MNNQKDPNLNALVSEAEADRDVIGLVLLGSRSVGDVAAESDYDAIFVVTDEAAKRFENESLFPQRGADVFLSGMKNDIWNEAVGNLLPDKVERWMLPAFAESLVLYDRTGETTRTIDGLRKMTPEQAASAVNEWYDNYLNGLYRSLKCWRRGNILGARLEAAQSADALLHVLFALEQHWRPYSSRLKFHLHKLACQGWHAGELSTNLLDLVTSGEPGCQQRIARRVVPLLQERGFGSVYDAWEGQIDHVLNWESG